MSLSDSKAASFQEPSEARQRPRAGAALPLGRLPFRLSGTEFLILAGILAATVLVYLRSLPNGFVFDDGPAIVQNPLLPTWGSLTESLKHDVWFFRDPGHLPQCNYYRPMQNLWIALNWHLFHYHPVGWHLAKIVLHLCVVVLAFRIAQLLTGSVPAALVAAGLFALSPVQVEAVTWITAIPEVLSALFMMGAFCLYIGPAPPRTSLRLWPLLLYACAAFTHESAIFFPAVVAAYEWLLGEGDSSPGLRKKRAGLPPIMRSLQAAIPFAGVALLYLAARVAVFGWSGLIASHEQMVSQIGPGLHLSWQMLDTGHSSAVVLMSLPGVITEYLALIVLPWLPGPAHPVYFVTAPAIGNFWLPAGILTLVIAVGGWFLWHSGRRNLYAFGIAWWMIMLAPALHLNSVFNPVSDRYEYMPLFGLCLIGGDWLVRKLGPAKLQPRAAFIVWAAMAITMVVFSRQGQAVWHDDLTLFRQSVAAAPADAALHSELAKTLISRNDLAGGAEELKRASLYDPGDATLHESLAQTYLLLGRKREAEQEDQAAFDILAPWHRNNPNLGAAKASGHPSPAEKPSAQGSP